MSTLADRLREARERAGFGTASEGAEAAGAKVPTYIQHENGTRGFPAAKARRYARAFGVTPEWLLYGTPMKGRGGIPIVGYVGAAAEFFGFDDYAMGAGMEEIDPPPDAPRTAVAVVVRGDSGYPMIRDGWVLIYWEKFDDPSLVLGENCFVRTKDGRTLVKMIEPGTEPGRWTLNSMNASTAPIRNVEIEWAAPIAHIISRRARRAA